MSDFKNPITVNGAKVWTETNDGSGSTLDADLLDGLHSSSFSQVGHTHVMADITNNVAFSAKPSVTQSYTSNTNTKVILGLIDFDLLSNFSTINSRFIVPFSGIYKFFGSIALSGNSTGRLMVFVNGIERQRIFTTASNMTGFNGGCDLLLNANDYVEFYVNFGSSRVIQILGTYFSGVRIS